MPFTIGGAVTMSSVALAANKPSPQTPGTAITFKATPTGGTAPYQYKWWVYDGATWTVARDWSPTNTYTWPATMNGAHYVGVWARGAGSTVDAPEAATSMPFTIAGTGTAVMALSGNVAFRQRDGRDDATPR